MAVSPSRPIVSAPLNGRRVAFKDRHRAVNIPKTRSFSGSIAALSGGLRVFLRLVSVPMAFYSSGPVYMYMNKFPHFKSVAEVSSKIVGMRDA